MNPVMVAQLTGHDVVLYQNYAGNVNSPVARVVIKL